MTASHYLQALAAVPLFAGCSNDELELIARLADEVRVGPGEQIVEEGKSGHEAYVVLEGSVSVERNGKQIAALGVGEPFGELALLDGGPRTATVVALEPTLLLVIGRREFLGLLDEVPGLSRRLLANLAGRIRELDSRTFG
ncbi:MAG: hypothetical protein KatS3mg008_1456 [Acidimicrobiales bacterium]|nr:MAG: hypothetical protein KatS3mg008_1456 [Acidimicrobiales bacterium]